MNATKISDMTCPAGTYGLAVETWTRGDVCAVAADWTRDGSPIHVYRNLPDIQMGWRESIFRVGGLWDNPHDALRSIVRSNVEATGGEVYNLVRQHAVEIEDPNATW